MKTCKSGFAFVLAGAVAGVVALQAGNDRLVRALDGTQWKIHLAPEKSDADKGEKAYDDTLKFADGRFTSSVLQARGFATATYKGELEPSEAEFEVEQTSESNGIATWLGQIRGNHVAGRLEWRKKSGVYVIYNFTGTKA